jgi:hypothetical protein
MIRIAITPAAYAAIAATLALGTVAVEPERAADGSVYIWLYLPTGASRKQKPRRCERRA